MKPLSTSIYTFSDLIEGGYLYVDKTELLHSLVAPFKGQFFLARPRRFGKSLLISTLKATFQGRRALFEGLHIDSTDYEWPVHPVIHLDLGSVQPANAAELEQHLLRLVRRAADDNGCTVTAQIAYQAFEDLIIDLAKRDGRTVILVDEYDKPILGNVGNDKLPDILRILKGFYSVIKTTEAHQRFALLTGVSKFSRVSIFSDLNNLTDLTMDLPYATLLGYTQEELEANFAGYIDKLTVADGRPREDLLAEIRAWYNGYRFHHAAAKVYNPVSVMNLFRTCEFRNYWFETGTPSFLIDLLKRQPVDLGGDDLTVPETAFSTYDPKDLHPLPLLVQTGYLTIGACERLGDIRYYTLSFPNLELEQSFSYWLARGMSCVPDVELSGALRRMVRSLQAGDVDAMLESLKTFFSQVPNTISIANEKYYQTIFFTVFKLIGAMIDAEVNTNIGRVGAVVQAETDIFVLEFKLRGNASDAMEQIEAKQYAAPYRDDPRPVTLVGVEFNREQRNITDWLVKQVPE